MKIYLKKAIFVNRAPFNKLNLDFNENEVAVLSAVNGKGKTTILSHLVDAFYEMVREGFPDEFEDKENKLYRVSSSTYNIDQSSPSFVYFRFYTSEGDVDYVDIRNVCTEEQYNLAINIENKIPFNQIQPLLQKGKYIKKISSNFNDDISEKIFFNNIITYFPSYRYEQPGYLNEPYKIKLDFNKTSRFTGHLKNPIEVVSGLHDLANWIMDIVLDLQYTNTTVANLKQNLDKIISLALETKKYGNLRFGVGPRNFGSTRIQIIKTPENSIVYPTIFNLSSGESSILCLFGELLRQADNNVNNVQLSEVTGIVLIDEIDKHLHIKLQKEILPKLFNLFPNVQFIVSSHSPFLGMGLADELMDRTKIIDLDNLGISKDPTNNAMYQEVYDMMILENERFKGLYHELSEQIKLGVKPIIITEGKTDAKHIKKAKEKLAVADLDIDFFEFPENGWGDTTLNILLENLSKFPNTRKVIGIFDRDNDNIIKIIKPDELPFKDYGNNIFAFCLPVPEVRSAYSNISIEFYYSDAELKKDKGGKCLYFDNEIDYLYNKSLNKSEIRKLETVRANKENEKKIFCEDIGDSDWIHSKTRFAELVEGDAQFIDGFDFTNFNLIFNKIKQIINPAPVEIHETPGSAPVESDIQTVAIN